VLKVIDGQRSSLECEMIEAICFGNMNTYKALIDRLNHRANLASLNSCISNTEEIPHQEKSPD
jgi:hypothetical protein